MLHAPEKEREQRLLKKRTAGLIARTGVVRDDRSPRCRLPTWCACNPYGVHAVIHGGETHIAARCVLQHVTYREVARSYLYLGIYESRVRARRRVINGHHHRVKYAKRAIRVLAEPEQARARIPRLTPSVPFTAAAAINNCIKRTRECCPRDVSRNYRSLPMRSTGD